MDDRYANLRLKEIKQDLEASLRILNEIEFTEQIDSSHLLTNCANMAMQAAKTSYILSGILSERGNK